MESKEITLFAVNVKTHFKLDDNKQRRLSIKAIPLAHKHIITHNHKHTCNTLFNHYNHVLKKDSFFDDNSSINK